MINEKNNVERAGTGDQDQDQNQEKRSAGGAGKSGRKDEI